jgi:antitoxin CptB
MTTTSEQETQNREEQAAMLQRVRWRCRRGLLELDIIFVRFIEAQYLKLSVEERQTFEELLDLPDNPLWDMVSGRKDAGSDAQAALLLKINTL